jgi:hypothetical protein
MTDDVRAALTPLLPNVRLRAINVHGLEVRRREGDKLTADTEMQSAIEQAFRAGDNSFSYRTTITLDNEAIFLEVIISADYQLEDAREVLGETSLQAAFGQYIAMPAVWPFMRQRVYDLSSALGIPPVVMPMWLPDDVVLERVSPDEESSDLQD